MPSRRVLRVKWCVPTLGRCVAKAGTRVSASDWCVPTLGTRVGTIGPGVATIGWCVPTVGTRVATVGTRVATIATHAPIFAIHRGMIPARGKISVARASGRLLVGSAILRNAANCATDRAYIRRTVCGLMPLKTVAAAVSAAIDPVMQGCPAHSAHCANPMLCKEESLFS